MRLENKYNPSRSDRELIRRENEEALEHYRNPEEFWPEMVTRLDVVINNYFPETASESFQPPHRKTLQKQYADAIGKYDANLNRSQAFAAAAAIRYVDDFIDEALWSDLPRYDRDEITEKLHKFLDKVYEIVAEYDKTMPYELTDLPKLELYLYLHPDQETFDDKIEELVKMKSLDLHYINAIARKLAYKRDDLDEDAYMRIAIRDYARDFLNESWKEDTDFNLYGHIINNNLHPGQLKKMILDQLEKLDYGLAQRAQDYDYEGMKSYKPESLSRADSKFVKDSADVLQELDLYMKVHF